MPVSPNDICFCQFQTNFKMNLPLNFKVFLFETYVLTQDRSHDQRLEIMTDRFENWLSCFFNIVQFKKNVFYQVKHLKQMRLKVE